MEEVTVFFSIVCPVYNSEKFLKTTINSVLEQSFSNWELILINDGSTDQSEEICESYVKESRKITLINTPNNGQMSARRLGIRQAKGKYVLFLDSDDAFPEDALDKLFNKIANNSFCDCVVFNAKTFTDEVNIQDKRLPQITNERLLDSHFDILRALFCEYTFGYLWMYCFKKEILLSSFLSENGFENLRFTEDVAFLFKTLNFCKKVMLINDCLYSYRISNQSITHTLTYNDRKDRFKVFEYIYGSKEFNDSLISPNVLDTLMWALVSLLESSIKEKEYRVIFRQIRDSKMYNYHLVNYKPKVRQLKAINFTIKHRSRCLCYFMLRK